MGAARVVGVLGVGETLSSLVGQHRYGGLDPTTFIGADQAWRAVRTPDGPGTLHLRSSVGEVTAEAYGPGGPWLIDRVSSLLGAHDEPDALVAHHPVVAKALRDHRAPRIGAGGVVFAPLVAAVLGQRITGKEAAQQWAAVCRLQPEVAPGPPPIERPLLLPPDPEHLASLPYWVLHRLGIDKGRANTISAVARRARRLEEAVAMHRDDAYRRLEAIPGVGPWTSAVALASAIGDPDAVAVGDFHLRNVVAYAFTGKPRGTDEQMLELLAPYAGHRGRVIALLYRAGWKAPAFGPRRAIVPISQM